MKYINEFEEFDPSDFEDFEQGQKDLKNLGFPIPILGEDYGFGPDLRGENDGKTPLYLTADLIKTLSDKGILKSWSPPVFFPSNESFGKIEKHFEKVGGSNWKRLRSKFQDIETHPIDSRRFGDHVQLPKNTPEKDFSVVWIGSERESSGYSPGSYVMGGQYGFPKGWIREVDEDIPQEVIKIVYDSFVELINGK